MSVTSLIRRLDQLKRGGERKGDLDGDAVESTRARLRDVATDALRTDLVAADDVKTEDALWNYCYYQPLQVLKRSAAGADAGAGAVEGEGGGGGGGGEIQSLLNEATGTYHFLLSCFNDDGAVPAGASSEATSTVAAKQRTDAFVGKCLIRLGDIGSSSFGVFYFRVNLCFWHSSLQNGHGRCTSADRKGLLRDGCPIARGSCSCVQPAGPCEQGKVFARVVCVLCLQPRGRPYVDDGR